MNWLLHVLGVDNVAGRAYAWWSGAGSDIGEIALIGAVLGLFRRHNCEVKWCPRLGRHLTAAGHRLCRRHHPDDHLTAEAAAAAHRAALSESRVK